MITVYNRFYSTDVGLPGSIGLAVGVGHIVTENYALAANFAFCHLYTS
jgi:hypothetical protein